MLGFYSHYCCEYIILHTIIVFLSTLDGQSWLDSITTMDALCFVSNCYFVNLNGHPCRRNGGVYDGFVSLDTLSVENCTHIMTQGSIYKWRNYTAQRININHNTFVNCAGSKFMDLGTQINVNYTNNLFVNCNVQPFSLDWPMLIMVK